MRFRCRRSLSGSFGSLLGALAVLLSCAALGCGWESPPLDSFVIGRGGDSVGLDPAHEEDGESFKVAELIFDTLVQYGLDGTEPAPGLARSWTASEDGLVWTFELRRGVTFHNGEPFTSDAVIQSLERQQDESHPLHKYGGPYLYWTALGMDGILDSVEALSDFQVRFTLKNPYGPFLHLLALPPFSIASPRAMKELGDDFGSNPVGTGPFRFVSWVKDDRIVLERNESYWAGRPPLREVTFRSIPENVARLLELERGNIHLLEFIEPDSVGEIRANTELRLLEQEGMNVGYMAMNMQNSPLDDVRVRYAINHAVNKQEIVENLFGGLATAGKTPIPASVWGHHDGIVDFEYDPEKARALIAEAFPDGFPRPLRFYVFSNPRPYFLNPQAVGLAIQSDLEKAGIPTEMTANMEWGAYLEAVKAGEHDLAILGWIADYPDPDNFLYFNLSETNAVPPAGNIAFYRSGALEELLLAGQKEVDQAKRLDLYRQAQETIRKDAPWVVISHMKDLAATRANVDGYRLHPLTWKHFWRTRLKAE